MKKFKFAFSFEVAQLVHVPNTGSTRARNGAVDLKDDWSSRASSAPPSNASKRKFRAYLSNCHKTYSCVYCR